VAMEISIDLVDAGSYERAIVLRDSVKFEHAIDIVIMPGATVLTVNRSELYQAILAIKATAGVHDRDAC
jgi:hypothetical protein